MKEVITVELDKADVETAIEDMLLKHGYVVEKIEFKSEINHFSGKNDLNGAKVIVTKNTKVEEA